MTKQTDTSVDAVIFLSSGHYISLVQRRTQDLAFVLKPYRTLGYQGSGRRARPRGVLSSIPPTVAQNS